MSKVAKQAGCNFRPHFKTHQSVKVGEWFRDFGVEKIAVSSLQMAEKFAVAGWDDILVAIPLNLNETDRINLLAKRIRLGLVVECDITVAMLKRELQHPVDVYVELDSGYNRTGISWDDFVTIQMTIDRISQAALMTFRGFIVHAGQTYQVNTGSAEKNRLEILDIHKESLTKLQIIRGKYEEYCSDLVISYGDTPSCSLAKDFGPVTEIRPGNFVFYDMMMVNLGVCQPNDVAISMACPVIGMNHKRQEVAVYGGAVHFSKEFITVNSKPMFGQLVQSSSLGWGNPIEGAILKGLSQEHGIVSFSTKTTFNRIGIGDILYFLPVHSCLTASTMGQYTLPDGEVIVL